MNNELVQFIQRYLGVPRVGTNPVNSGQCVGLVELWVDTLHLPRIPGNAKDMPGLADLSAYSLTMNTPRNFPPPGAVVCWGSTWGAGYGHTAVVVAASVLYLGVFEQNDPDGSPPVLGTHGYHGVLGWLVGK